MNTATTNEKQVYKLVQSVTAGLPPVTHTAEIIFHAGNEGELQELVSIFRSGRLDDRIEMRLPPDEVYEEGRIEIVTEGFYTPDGKDVKEQFMFPKG